MLEHIYFSKQTWDSNQIRNFDSLSIQNSFHVLLSNSFRWRISWTFFKRHEKNSFSCFRIEKIFRKRVDLTKQKHEPMCKLNIMKKVYCVLALTSVCFWFLYHDGCHFAGLYKIVPLIWNQLLWLFGSGIWF